MSRDPRVYLEDVLESIRRINTYVAGIGQEQLAGDELRLDAVVRNLEVIGEADHRARQLIFVVRHQAIGQVAGNRPAGGLPSATAGPYGRRW